MTTTYQRIWIGHVAIGALGLCLLGLVGRLAYIQTEMRPELLAYAQERQTSTVELPGVRGRILDRRGRVLAGSHDQPTLFADPLLVTDKPATAAWLAGFKSLELSPREVLAKLDPPRRSRFVVLKRGVDSKTAEMIRDKAVPGIGTFDEPTRVYAMGTLAAHLLGYVGMEGKGLEGVELAYERYLKFAPGQRVIYWDARRQHALRQDPEGYVAPRNGMDVVLTIDAAIQEIVEREIAKAREKYKAECAMGIVMSPKTGEIFAMAIAPGYSPADPGRDAVVRRNRILTDPVEPGSIFKPFVLVGAIAAGLTRPEEVIFCYNGCMPVAGRLLHDHKAYGNLSVEQILTQSSNIGMAILGMRMGNQRIYDTLYAFGLGRKTGIDLPGEDMGLMLPWRRWQTPSSTSHVPMGHEVAFTPIQLITAFCAFANGGRLPKPYVVAGVVDRAGNIIEDRRPKDEFPQVQDATSIETLRQLLTKVVTDGTGKPAALDDWTVMGKTGTAQIPYSPEDRKRLHLKRGGYEPGAYLGSFIAAAPASDPQVTVLVMVRKPVKSIGYYGGTVSAPAVKAILQEVLSYLNVPHDRVRTAADGVRLVRDPGGD